MMMMMMMCVCVCVCVCKKQMSPWQPLYLDFSKSKVGHFVHEAVEKSGGATCIHTELSLRCEVVGLLWMCVCVRVYSW